MGGNFEVMMNADGKSQLLLIDQRGKNVDVGSKLSDFNIIKKLGSGHFGSVYLVSSKKTKFLYAMKEILADQYKSDRQRELVEREIKILENLRHPNVITYFNSFTENNNFYIITEYINGGSLDSLLEKNLLKGQLIEEKKIFDILIQSLSGLIYLHNTKKVIHRNIKPDSILIDLDGKVKILDFGLSALDSEEADESIKFHGTVVGPMAFMAPEMCMGKKYDFKSDIYMLGLTFFFIMSGQLATEKNEKIKITDIYSEDIRKFIQKLLTPSLEERPTAIEAYIEATYLYLLKYAKITSICSTLQCLLSFPSISSYFKGSKIQTYVDNDEKNENKKYLVTKSFKNALFDIGPANFNYEIVKIECLNLRILLFNNKERFENSTEVGINSFIAKLLVKLHNELNKSTKFDNENPGSNNINEEEDKINESIDYSDENSVLSAKMKVFIEYFRSKISDYFFYIDKASLECNKCQKIFKYTSDIICLTAFYPYRATIYLNKTDIDVIDLFKHYRKKRLFQCDKMNCNCCGAEIDGYYKAKIMYTSPLNLIMFLSNEKPSKFKLTINEYIDISEFAERRDYSTTKYYLVGAIFYDEEINGYISISKMEKNEWFCCDGSQVKKSTFNDISNHNNVRVLFYSSS